MKVKKFLSLGIAALMAFSIGALAACGNSDDSGTNSGDNGGSSATKTGSITVWCASEVASLTESQLAEFSSTYTDCPYTFTVEQVSEGEAATNMITDVTAGGDIFFFAQDQLARLVQVGALTAVADSYVEDVTSENDTGSVAAATLNSTLYAFPVSSDNGFFMYYDKSVISEDILNDQTALIAACKAAGKTINFQLTSSIWYGASYFFATGCESTWSTDDSGEFISRVDTFNSANGIIAMRGMAELINSDVFVDDDTGVSSLSAQNSAIVVSGTWDYSTAVTLLGDNLGCAKLWSFNVDGTDYQLGSYSGYKLLGIKPQTDSTKAAWCQAVAYYLAGEECQSERFASNAWGPSNKVAASDEAVAANPALVALTEQNAYATPQGQYPNSWWDAGAAIGASIQALATTTPSTSDLQTILNTYTETCDGILEATTELIVAGSMSDDTWTTAPTNSAYILGYDNNTYASKSESSPLMGIWTFEVTLAAGGMFRIVDKNWGTYAGYSNLTSDSDSDLTGNDDDNIVVAIAGTYTVTLDTTGTTATIKVNLTAEDTTEVPEVWVIAGNFADATWDATAEAYQLTETYLASDYTSWSSDDPYTGKWTITVTVVDAGGGEGGYLALLHYNLWSSQIGYDYLDVANSYSGCGGSGTSVLLPVGTYTVTLDTTGTDPVITIVQAS